MERTQATWTMRPFLPPAQPPPGKGGSMLPCTELCPPPNSSGEAPIPDVTAQCEERAFRR